MPALASVKHEAFSEEQEWRFVAMANDTSSTKFRLAAYGLTPFIELPLALSVAVYDVVVGPGVQLICAHSERVVC